MRTPSVDIERRVRLLVAAVLWLCAGGVLLLTTLVPAHNDLFGWTPAFALVGAPLVVLLTLEPKLPRQLLAMRRVRRRPAQLIWH